MIFIFDLVTVVERQAWQFVVSFPSENRKAEDPAARADGDFTELSLNDLFSLYCFREVFRDVAIVSIDCFWVEEEKSSFPDPGTQEIGRKFIFIGCQAIAWRARLPEYSDDSGWP